jgi:LuxR family maltose regulon positive regulatory protein
LGLVQRSRLIERLNECIRPGCRLTLISAPAGFGKTTLLANWIRQTNRQVAWLSLDAGDNEPTRFWSYVISALQTVRPHFGQATLALLESIQPPPIKSVLTDLMNEVAGTDLDWILILDDYHVITEPAINDEFAYILDHLPPQMHLILASRADPPWPLARLRARRTMVELRTEDLRFTLEEAATFLNSTMGLDLSPQDIALLDTRTEGWIAGLQLAALSMQGRDDVSGFVRAFSGSHRFVLDYLVEEVLGRQPDDLYTFLIQTSILDRLTASLCDAVLAAAELDSPAILAHLEQNNLFLIPLDDERRWYRYHHLFASLLSNRLTQQHPDLIPTLHGRASKWYETEGLIAKAIEHGLQSSDMQHVGQLIANNALAIMEHSELAVLKRLLETMPDPIVQAHPWLSLAQAWICNFTSQLDAVEPLLQRVESMLPNSRLDTESQRITGHVAALRTGVPYVRGEMDRAIQRAQEALNDLPSDELAVRAWVTMVQGLALGWQGHLVEAERVLQQAREISRTGQISHVSLLTLCNLASTQRDRGHLVHAAETFREAIELGHTHTGRSGQPLPVTGYADVYLGDILCEWNDLASAQEHIERGMGLCIQWGEPELLTSVYRKQASFCLAVGDPDGARTAIQKAKQVAADLSAWYADRVAIHEVGLLLALGEIDQASDQVEQLVHKLGSDSPTDLSQAMICLALVKLSIARGQAEQALQRTPKLLAFYRSAPSLEGQIWTLIQQSIAQQAQGDRRRAATSLKLALTLAKPEGYVRTFVEAGAPIDGLLRQALAQGIAPVYVRKLLDARSGPMSHSSTSTIETPTAPLIDPLTERELQVLRLLPTHLSSTEIASQLYVSKNTVRSHIGHIYDKLGVHSRDDAVQRAHELGLL